MDGMSRSSPAIRPAPARSSPAPTFQELSLATGGRVGASAVAAAASATSPRSNCTDEACRTCQRGSSRDEAGRSPERSRDRPGGAEIAPRASPARRPSCRSVEGWRSLQGGSRKVPGSVGEGSTKVPLRRGAEAPRTRPTRGEPTATVCARAGGAARPREEVRSGSSAEPRQRRSEYSACPSVSLSSSLSKSIEEPNEPSAEEGRLLAAGHRFPLTTTLPCSDCGVSSCHESPPPGLCSRSPNTSASSLAMRSWGRRHGRVVDASSALRRDRAPNRSPEIASSRRESRRISANLGESHRWISNLGNPTNLYESLRICTSLCGPRLLSSRPISADLGRARGGFVAPALRGRRGTRGRGSPGTWTRGRTW